MEPIDPYTLIGKQFRIRRGGDYGHLVVGFHAPSNNLQVVPIRWSTGEPLAPSGGPQLADAWWALARYQLDRVR